MVRARWTGWVHRSGDEPDYRFSFANERTFLAWVRTALAVLAGGVGLGATGRVMPNGWQHGPSGSGWRSWRSWPDDWFQPNRPEM